MVMSELNVSYSCSAAAEDSLTEVSLVYNESGPDHGSGLDIPGSASIPDPRGLEHNDKEGSLSHVHGQHEAAAQEECGGKRSVASYAKLFTGIYGLVYPF